MTLSIVASLVTIMAAAMVGQGWLFARIHENHEMAVLNATHIAEIHRDSMAEQINCKEWRDEVKERFARIESKLDKLR